MTFLPFVVVLAVLSVAVLGLIVYRRQLTAREDDTVHLHAGEEKAMADQEVLALRVAKVDRYGQILTAVVVIGAILLLAVYIYTTQIAITGVKTS